MERSREQLLLVKECHPLYLATEARIYLGCADFAWIACPVYCSSPLPTPQLWRGLFSCCAWRSTPLGSSKVSQVTFCSNHLLDFWSAYGTSAATPPPPSLGQLPTLKQQTELSSCIAKRRLCWRSMAEQSLVWVTKQLIQEENSLQEPLENYRVSLKP